MPVNMPSHAHGQGYTDLNFMIPELVGGGRLRQGPRTRQAQGDFATAGSATISYADRVDHARTDATVGSEAFGQALGLGSMTAGPGRLVYGIEADHIDGPWAHPDDYRAR
jgi:hypothetical protein